MSILLLVCGTLTATVPRRQRMSERGPAEAWLATMRWRLAVGLLALAFAGRAAAASLSLEKGPAVLGRADSLTVTVHTEEPAGTEDRPLRLSVNVGSFGEVVRLGPGVYRAVYQMPATRFPQVAIVAAWRETGPDAPIDFLRLPLYGITKLEAMAPPGSEVRAQVGGETFGPVITGAKGLAAVSVEVPPNVPEATIQVKEKGGPVTSRKVAISVPAYNRITVALVPHAILANAEDWARVEVFYDNGATELPAEKVKLAASEGAVTLQRAEHGRFTYRYQPVPGSTASEVSFAVAVDGDPASRGSAKLSLGLPLADEVLVTPPAQPLLADGHSTAVVKVRVFDSKRLGLPRQNVELMANGQPIKGVEDKGKGVYEAHFTAPASYPANGLVVFSAAVARPDGQSVASVANYQVLPLPIPQSATAQVAPSPLVADGQSKALITLDVRDKAGLPLKGAQLIALPSAGRAGQVVEVGEGRYRIDYLAPDTVPAGDEALVKVVDSSGTFEKSFPVSLRKEARLMLGARGGLTHSLGALVGPRVGLEAFAPLRLAGAYAGVGVTASYGAASQEITDAVTSSTSTASFVPVALRFSYAPYVSARLALSVGAGPVAVFAQVQNSANGYRAAQIGLGAMGFANGALNLGPGQLVAELGYAYAPVEHPDFHLEAGGLSFELGYRFALF